MKKNQQASCLLILLCLIGCLFCCMQDEAGGTEGDDCAILYTHPVLGAENFVHEEGPCDTVVVAQGIDEVARLAALHVEDAVATVHAGVVGLDGDVYLVALVAAAYDVVAQL